KDPMLRIDTYQDLEGNTKVVFSFHHVLFDGRGCGLLLQHLTGESDDSELFPKRIPRKGLFRQIVNMFQVKRLVEHSSRKPIAYLDEKVTYSPRFTLNTVSFTAEETAAIDAQAREQG